MSLSARRIRIFEQLNSMKHVDVARLCRFSVIRRGLLLFWALWLSVVVVTNMLNALVTIRVLPAGFVFSSGNWAWIGQTMNPLGVPVLLQAVMFVGVIAWEAAAAIAFWVAFARFRDRPLAAETVAVAACILNLSLWAAFEILDEVFLAYNPEGVHRAIFANMILTTLALYVLPAGTATPSENYERHGR